MEAAQGDSLVDRNYALEIVDVGDCFVLVNQVPHHHRH